MFIRLPAHLVRHLFITTLFLIRIAAYDQAHSVPMLTPAPIVARRAAPTRSRRSGREVTDQAFPRAA